MKTKRFSFFMLAALCGTSLCACMHAPASTQTPTTTESADMIMEADMAGSPQPKLDAETVTRRILDLILGSKTISDFTPERVSAVTGVEMKPYDANSYSASEVLTQDWRYVIDMSMSTLNGPQLTFGFFPANAGQSPPSSDICKTSLSRFSEELENSGFGRKTTYGEHEMVISYLFDRNGLTAKISTIGNSNTSDKDNNECIYMIVVN